MEKDVRTQHIQSVDRLYNWNTTLVVLCRQGAKLLADGLVNLMHRVPLRPR